MANNQPKEIALNEVARRLIEPNSKSIELKKIKTGSYRPVTQFGTKLLDETIKKVGLNYNKTLLVLELQEKEGEYEYECLGGNHRLAVFRKMNILEYPCLIVKKDKQLSSEDKSYLCYWDNACNQTFEEGDFQKFERLYNCLKDDKHWIFPADKPKTEHNMINQNLLLKTLHPNEWYLPKLSSTLVPLAKMFLEDWWTDEPNEKAFLAWKKLHDQYGEGYITCRTLTHIAKFKQLSSTQREKFFERVSKMYQTVENKRDRKSYETLEKMMDKIIEEDKDPKKRAAKPTGSMNEVELARQPGMRDVPQRNPPTKQKRKRSTTEKTRSKKSATAVKKTKTLARESKDDDSDDDSDDSDDEEGEEVHNGIKKSVAGPKKSDSGPKKSVQDMKAEKPFKRYEQQNEPFTVWSYLDAPFDGHQTPYMNRKFSLIIFAEQDFQLLQNVLDKCMKQDGAVVMITPSITISKFFGRSRLSFDFFAKKGWKEIIYCFPDQQLHFYVFCNQTDEDLTYEGAKLVCDFSEAEKRHQLEYGDSISDLPLASWEQFLKGYDGDILNLYPLNGVSICAAINLHKNMLCHEKEDTVRATILPHLSKRVLDLCPEEHVVWYNNNNNHNNNDNNNILEDEDGMRAVPPPTVDPQQLATFRETLAKQPLRGLSKMKGIANDELKRAVEAWKCSIGEKPDIWQLYHIKIDELEKNMAFYVEQWSKDINVDGPFLFISIHIEQKDNHFVSLIVTKELDFIYFDSASGTSKTVAKPKPTVPNMVREVSQRVGGTFTDRSKSIQSPHTCGVFTFYLYTHLVKEFLRVGEDDFSKKNVLDVIYTVVNVSSKEREQTISKFFVKHILQHTFPPK